MAGAKWLNQSMPYPTAYMAHPAWPMPRPQIQQSSPQAEHEELAMQRQELETRKLEVERRIRALNLNAVRDAETKSAAPSVKSSQTRTSQEQAPIKPERASSHAASQRSLPLKQGLPSGITSTVTTRTVKSPLTSHQAGTGQDMIGYDAGHD